MPNYVRNIFIEISDEEKYKKFVLNDKGEIDFGILIPMPITLECGDTCLGNDYWKNNKFHKFAMNAKTFDEFQKLIYDSTHVHIPTLNSQEKLFAIKDANKRSLIHKAYTTWNQMKIGYPSWYEWRKDKWGTKWNACKIELSYPSIPQECIFDTAWSAPTPWLEELAKHLDFVLLYADEDIGVNCGILEAKNGVLRYHDDTNYVDPSTVFAYAVHGDTIDYEDCDDEEAENRKYLYDNRYAILGDFFAHNNCYEIYERNESKINELI